MNKRNIAYVLMCFVFAAQIAGTPPEKIFLILGVSFWFLIAHATRDKD